MLKKFKEIMEVDEGYIVRGDEADILLVFLTNDIIRIRVSFDRQFEEESYTLVTTAWEDRLDDLLKKERNRISPLKPGYKETEQELIFETSSMKILLNKEKIHLKIFDQNENLIYSDLPERAFEKDYLGRVTHYSRINLENDHFYGFGEKTGKVDKKGYRMRMSPKDAIGHDPEFGDPLYKHIPFYIKLNERNKYAFGMFYHNSYESVFDMGKEISGYWEPYSYYQTEGGDIDLFFINGPTIEKVLENYTYLTGKQAMPPKQSLGFTASTMYYAELDKDCDKAINQVIDKHLNSDMLIDNFKLASGYSSGEEDNLRYVFNWNQKRFPDPDAFFKKMNDKGINVIVNLKPGILANHPMKEIFEKNDVFVKDAFGEKDYIGRWWGGEGRFFDFTNPRAREVWKKCLKENILSKGTITVWNDNCEYDGIEDKEAVCYFDGRPGKIAQLKPLQANMMAFLAKEAVEEEHPNQRPYIISRAGFAGIQRYAQTWAGDNLTDWRTLKFNIATIIGMGLSGVANTGCDIGGFAGPAPEGELLLRWIQNGIFQPRFCINSANSDNTVTQPWMYSEYEQEVKKAYRLRYQLLPYLYSLMYEAHQMSKPIMRPLFFEFQGDESCYDDQWMTFLFGPSILVANVLEKNAKSRKLYLPKGTTWYHMNNRMRPYVGGQTIDIPVELDSIPMFLRANSIFVKTDDIRRITKDEIQTLEIICGGEDAQFTFYEDDGITNNFEKGIYKKTQIKVEGKEQKVISFYSEGSWKSSINTIDLSIVSKEKGAYWVTVNNEKLAQFLNEEDFLQTDEGWYYDLSTRMVRIRYKQPSVSDYEVVVSLEKFDLIGMTNK